MATKQYRLYSKKMDSDIDPGGLQYVQPPKNANFSVDVDFDDKVFKQVEKDSILLKEMNQAANQAYSQTVSAITSKLKLWDKLIKGMVDKGEKEATIKKQIAGLNDAMKNDVKVGIVGAELAIQKVWTDYAKKKKQYKGYKIKFVLKITGLVAGLATSIALMATAPFTGGASAAISIVGMVKSGVSLAKEISSAAVKVETSMKVLKTSLTAVETVAKTTKAGLHGNEISAAVFNQFLGAAQPNVKSCVTQLGTVESKLGGVEIKSHDLSKTLNGILDKQETLRKDFMAEVNKQLGKHPSSEAPKQIKLIEKRLDQHLASNYKLVRKQIDSVESTHDRWLKGSQMVKNNLRPRVIELAKMRKGMGYKALDVCLTLSDIPLSLVDGNAIKLTSNTIATGLAPCLASMAYDEITDRVLDGTLLAK